MPHRALASVPADCVDLTQEIPTKRRKRQLRSRAKEPAFSTPRAAETANVIDLSGHEQQSEDEWPCTQAPRKRNRRAPICSDDEGANECESDDDLPLPRPSNRTRGCVSRVLFSDDEDEGVPLAAHCELGSSDQAAAMVEFVEEDYSELQKCEIEGEGNWVHAILYKHKRRGHVVVWLSESSECEGLDGSYSMKEGVLRDGDGDVITTRGMQDARSNKRTDVVVANQSKQPLRVNIYDSDETETEADIEDEAADEVSASESADERDKVELAGEEIIPNGFMVCYDCKDRGADYIKHKDSFSASVKRGVFGKFHLQPFCLQCSTGDQTFYIEKLQARAKSQIEGMGDEADEVRHLDQKRTQQRKQHFRQRGHGQRPAQSWRDPSSADWFSEEGSASVVLQSDEEEGEDTEGEEYSDGDELNDDVIQIEIEGSEEDEQSRVDEGNGGTSEQSNLFRGMYVLDVDFAMRDQAKGLGAMWQPEAPQWWGGANAKKGCWCVPVGVPVHLFALFDPHTPMHERRAYLTSRFEERQRVKQLGATFDWNVKKWWVSRAHPRLQELFGRWL